MEQALLYMLFTLLGACLMLLSNKGKEITPPEVKKVNLNPLRAYKEHKESEAVKREQEIMNKNLENINNYTGDSTGQKDI